MLRKTTARQKRNNNEMANGRSLAHGCILCCLGGGFALRLLAIHYRWEMPKFVYHDEVH